MFGLFEQFFSNFYNKTVNNIVSFDGISRSDPSFIETMVHTVIDKRHDRYKLTYKKHSANECTISIPDDIQNTKSNNREELYKHSSYFLDTSWVLVKGFMQKDFSVTKVRYINNSFDGHHHPNDGNFQGVNKVMLNPIIEYDQDEHEYRFKSDIHNGSELSVSGTYTYLQVKKDNETGIIEVNISSNYYANGIEYDRSIQFQLELKE